MRNVVVCHLSVDYLEARPGMRSSPWSLAGRNWFKCYRYFVTDISCGRGPPKEARSDKRLSSEPHCREFDGMCPSSGSMSVAMSHNSSSSSPRCAFIDSMKARAVLPTSRLTPGFIIRVNQILHADQKIVHSSNDIDLTSIDGPPVSPKPSHTNASDKCVECGRELCQPLILRSLPPTEIIKIASCRRYATIKAWTEAIWIRPELCQQGRDS